MSDTRTYFAQVIDGIVTDVRVVTQEFMDANPDRYTGTWVQTFHNTEGKVYAGIGFTYDGTNFICPPPIVESEV